MTNRLAAATPLFYARVAGLSYIITILIGIGSGLVDSKLLVAGDAAATSQNILDQGLLFRVQILAVLILYSGVVVLAWALYVLLKPVNGQMALFALLFRSGEAILGAATVLVSFAVALVVEEIATATMIETGQLQALAGVLLEVRVAGLDIVLVFVGLGGAAFCYLFLASRCIPRFLAAWGILVYLSMVVLACISILWADHPTLIELVLYSVGALFELSIGGWLLIKGVDIQHLREAGWTTS